MNNTNINISKGTSALNIKKLYDNLTYYDQYGNSIILFLILTTCIFLAHSYFKIMADSQPIKDDWVNQRCNPKVIPFAGFINKPDDKTISEYTQENFTYCVQDVVKNMTGFAVQPITFLTGIFEKLFESFGNDINGIRNMMNNVREAVKKIAEEIMGRLMNVMIPLIQMIIGVKDIMNKSAGTLTAGLYTSLGTYYTLKSALGAVVNLIVNILIILVGMIVPLLMFPFTAPAANPLIAIFVAISVPLSIILVVLTQAFGIKPNHPIPSICFDKDTELLMHDKSFKKISEISVGDKLENNNIVTAKMKFKRENADMYKLDDIVVSGSHTVKYEDSWILVRNHPKAVFLNKYDEEFIYCMNTSYKFFRINEYIFADWDEIYNQQDILDLFEIFNIYNKSNIEIKRENIHKYIDGGLTHDTKIKLLCGEEKCINEISLGDKLEGNILVTGLVEIDGKELNNIYEYRINGTSIKGGPNLIIRNNRSEVSTVASHFERKTIEKEEKLYHLITNKGFFLIKNVVIGDYNNCIELFLDI